RAAGHGGGPAARREGESVRRVASLAEGEGQAGGEAVPGAVGVDDRPRRRLGLPVALVVTGDEPTALAPGGRDHQARRRVERAPVVALAGIGRAADERVELN